MLMLLYIKMFIAVLVIHYTLKRQQQKAKPLEEKHKLLIERNYVAPNKPILGTIMQPLKWCLQKCL